MLDTDLRQSYRHGDHQFKGLSLTSKKSTEGSVGNNSRKDKNRRRLAIYSGLRRAIEKNPSSYKLCEQCRAKLSEKHSTASSLDSLSSKTIKVDKTKTVFDEAEIDYINDNQSKIYVSFVQVNPFVHFGIRTHYEKLTDGHCLHSLLDASHVDFLPMWLNLAPAMFLIWEVISIQLGFSRFYGDVFDRLHGTQKVMMAVSIGLTMLWLLTRTVYMVFYAKSYATEYTLNVACKVVTMSLLFCHAIMLFHQLLIEHGRRHQQEIGWFICYFVAILFVANIILTLFPAQRMEGADLQ